MLTLAFSSKLKLLPLQPCWLLGAASRSLRLVHTVNNTPIILVEKNLMEPNRCTCLLSVHTFELKFTNSVSVIQCNDLSTGERKMY